jgi:hypothetical protein
MQATFAGEAAFAGTWTPLANHAPSEVNLMLLLPDGTVMCAQNDDSTIGNGWFRLTPDVHGSYVHGTWTTLAHAHDTRLFYPSQVLRDGRVFVAGGEYGSGGPKAEVYNPLTNLWTQVNPPAALWNPSSDDFFDCNSEMLPDGRVLLMPVFPHNPGIPLIYDPVSNTWSNAGHLFRGSYQDEATWVKLTDDSVLTIDPFATFSERYIPSTNTWVDDGVVPVPMYDPFGFELGASLLLADGRALFLGSTGHTALYQPTGTPSPGTWVAGPDIPGSHGTPDAPAAMLVTGDILCAVSPIPTSNNHFPSPTSFYIYNTGSNSFSSENGPNGPTEPGPSFGTLMLALPDGTVLFSHFSDQLYVYAPTGGPIAAGKPAITSMSSNGDGSYHLVGTGFNGISEGASYGDDFQMNSNYPLVRLSDSSGNVYYARTYGWSSTGVRTGSTPVTTEFVPPPSLPPGSYTLVVVANGFASDPIAFGTFPTFCSGDGSTALCPCFNFGLQGHGCDNSAGTGGALMTGAGSASLSSDTVQMTSTGEMPSALSVLLQGDATISAVPYGDGLRCTGGNLKRLFSRSASGGAVTMPQGGDPTLSARSAAVGDPIAQGTSRTYQIYYRDPNATFCSSPPGGTFNVSNAVSLTWGP